MRKTLFALGLLAALAALAVPGNRRAWAQKGPPGPQPTSPFLKWETGYPAQVAVGFPPAVVGGSAMCRMRVHGGTVVVGNSPVEVYEVVQVNVLAYGPMLDLVGNNLGPLQRAISPAGKTAGVTSQTDGATYDAPFSTLMPSQTYLFTAEAHLSRRAVEGVDLSAFQPTLVLTLDGSLQIGAYGGQGDVQRGWLRFVQGYPSWEPDSLSASYTVLNDFDPCTEVDYGSYSWVLQNERRAWVRVWLDDGTQVVSLLMGEGEANGVLSDDGWFTPPWVSGEDGVWVMVESMPSAWTARNANTSTSPGPYCGVPSSVVYVAR